ncbi:MAG: hypothetical protein AB7I30_05635 [Isosphaeraceae bacterium]
MLDPTQTCNGTGQFRFQHSPQDIPDRAFVEVDDRYSVTIIRTHEGLIVDVYPNDWDCPIATLGVCDNDVAEADRCDEIAHHAGGDHGQ